MDLYHAGHLSLVLAALCGQGDILSVLGIMLALFGMGLVGGFAHCAAMCGPFVLMQLADPAAGGGFFLRKLAAGALPGYQFGRLTTYVALGAAAGGAGNSIVAVTHLHWLLAVLMGLAAIAFLLQAAKTALPRLSSPGLPRFAARLAVLLARLIRPSAGEGLHGYRLGLVLGFLPCGFLYGALIAAAAAGSAVAGAAAMAGFALGTACTLVTVGILGAAAALRWRGLAARLAAPIFLVNAMTLGGLAIRSLA